MQGMANTLSNRALCSLQDVKEYINLTDEVDQDNLLIRLINSASDAIRTITQREFKAIGSNPQTRVFDALEVAAGQYVYLGDLAELDSIDVVDRNDDLVQSVDLSDVVLYPRLKTEDEPYTHLRLRDVTLYSDYSLEVTGSWGWPSVPEDIRQAAIVTVAVWYARDIERFSATFSISQDRVELPRSLPPHVTDTINLYRAIPLR